MEIVTLSSEFEITLPQAVCEQLNWSPGMRLQVINVEGRIQLLPVRSMSELQGILKNIDTNTEREDDRL